MDRRDFCKTIFLSPVLSSLFFGLKPVKKGGELYLITDNPHLFLPKILDEIKKYVLTEGQNFTFLNSCNHAQHIQSALLHQGWKHVLSPAEANLLFSFHYLQQNIAPSFTLVKSGHVLDIRSKALSLLWTQMNKASQPSSLLTAVSFKNKKTLFPPGKKVIIYSDGRIVDKLSLNKDTAKTYTNPKGFITVRVEKGKAWIPLASCPHKICRFSPPVSAAGERIICAPNHFLLEIEGRSPIDTAIG